METYRTIVADDHPIFRDGLVRTLEEDPRFEVVATAGSAAESIAMAEELRPDVALLDISMPGNGINAAGEIARVSPDTRIAMLTVSEADSDVLAALKAGATGYILKGIGASELTDLLYDIAEGRSHISPNLAVRVLKALQSPPDVPVSPSVDALTKREEDILKRVANGLSNREIADTLGLKEKTVKHYMTTILQKLQVRNRVEAALLARDHFGT